MTNLPTPPDGLPRSVCTHRVPFYETDAMGVVHHAQYLHLLEEARILFLDEPTSGLGTEGMVRLAELVAELKRDHTIVIIEHDMRFLFRLADRISVIHWGQVIAEGTPDQLRQNPWVRASQLGQAE